MTNPTQSRTTPADARNVDMEEQSTSRLVPSGEPRFVRTRAAAIRLGLSPRTLEKHRVQGTGPIYGGAVLDRARRRAFFQGRDLRALSCVLQSCEWQATRLSPVADHPLRFKTVSKAFGRVPALRSGCENSRAKRVQNCEVCNDHAEFVHAHHTLPLSVQFELGLILPVHNFNWLCPTHHRYVHMMISVYVTNTRSGNFLDHIPDHRVDEWLGVERVFGKSMELFEEHGGMNQNGLGHDYDYSYWP